MAVFRLRVFTTVAELKSFTRAAEVLFLTQPAVSSQIKSLEEEFGARLFNREQNRVVLTEAGEILYRHATEIMRIYGVAKAEVGKMARSAKGKLVIGATSTIGKYYLPLVIEAFRQKHPDIEVVTQISNTETVLKSLFQGTLDLAIVSEPSALYGDSFLYHPYVKEKLVVIVPADHRWVGRTSVPLEELIEEPLLIREQGSGTRDIFSQHLEERGKRLEDLNIMMTLGSTEAIKGAVASGVGVAIISKCAVKLEVKAGLLKTMTIQGMEMTQSFTVVYPKKLQKLTSEAFFSFLQEHEKR
jgi:DNA-binding transcriptional LysR family regulator